MADTLRQAKDKALAIIARRMVTKKELGEKLCRYDFGEDIIDSVVLWAEEYKFVDDREYARVFTSDAVNLKHWGENRIKQALLFKGIDRDIVSECMAEFDFSHEAENIADAVLRRLGDSRDRKNIDRVVRHFMQKGYKYHDIKYAIDMALEDDDFEN